MAVVVVFVVATKFVRAVIATGVLFSGFAPFWLFARGCNRFYTSTGGGKHLTRINRKNGMTRDVGKWQKKNGGDRIVDSMEWSFSDEKLFGLMSWEGEPNRPQSFVRINRQKPRGAMINNVTKGSTGEFDLRGLAIDSNGTFFTHSLGGKSLCSVDPATGAVTDLFRTGLSNVIDLAYKIDADEIWAINGTHVHVINQYTGGVQEFEQNLIEKNPDDRMVAIGFNPVRHVPIVLTQGEPNASPIAVLPRLYRFVLGNGNAVLQATTNVTDGKPPQGGTIQCKRRNITKAPSTSMPTTPPFPTKLPTPSSSPSMFPTTVPVVTFDLLPFSITLVGNGAINTALLPGIFEAYLLDSYKPEYPTVQSVNIILVDFLGPGENLFQQRRRRRLQDTTTVNFRGSASFDGNQTIPMGAFNAEQVRALSNGTAVNNIVSASIADVLVTSASIHAASTAPSMAPSKSSVPSKPPSKPPTATLAPVIPETTTTTPAPLTPLPTTTSSPVASTSSPITLGPITPGATTAGPITPSPITPSPNTPSPNTPSPNTPSLNTLSPNTPSRTTSSPITSSPIASGPITPGPITPGPITPGPITPWPITPGPITPGPITPGPITPNAATPIPATPIPATPILATSNPATPILVTPNSAMPNPATPNLATPGPATPGTPNPGTPNPGTPNPGTPNPVTPIPATPSSGTPGQGTSGPGIPSPRTQSPAVTPSPRTTPSPVTPSPGTTPSPGATPSLVTPSPATPSSPVALSATSSPVTPSPATETTASPTALATTDAPAGSTNTVAPISSPSAPPSLSKFPSRGPSLEPTTSTPPSSKPSAVPTRSSSPSPRPSLRPTASSLPSTKPSVLPLESPNKPSGVPSSVPTESSLPSARPSLRPTASSFPSTEPSVRPSTSLEPSWVPSISFEPSEVPSVSSAPSSAPTEVCPPVPAQPASAPACQSRKFYYVTNKSNCSSVNAFDFETGLTERVQVLPCQAGFGTFDATGRYHVLCDQDELYGIVDFVSFTPGDVSTSLVNQREWTGTGLNYHDADNKLYTIRDEPTSGLPHLVSVDIETYGETFLPNPILELPSGQNFGPLAIMPGGFVAFTLLQEAESGIPKTWAFINMTTGVGTTFAPFPADDTTRFGSLFYILSVGVMFFNRDNAVFMNFFTGEGNDESTFSWNATEVLSVPFIDDAEYTSFSLCPL